MGQPVAQIVADDNLADNGFTAGGLANNGLDDACLADIGFGAKATIINTLLLVDTTSAIVEVDMLDQKLCFLYRFLALKALVVEMHLLEGKLEEGRLGLSSLFHSGRKNTFH